MNIKQFLIFKACDVLPPELKYHILEFVQNEAATRIQRYYTFKISKNIDIFREIMNNLIFKTAFKAAVILMLVTLTACGIYKKVDQREMPDTAQAKARKKKGAEATKAVISILSQK